MQQEVTIQSQSISKNFNWSDFITFRKMITLQVIQVVYIIVAIFITLGGLGILFSGNGPLTYFLPGGSFSGLLLIFFGNLIWRIWCELIIVFFRMNNTLSEINDHSSPTIKEDLV